MYVILVSIITGSFALDRDYFGSGSLSILMYNVQCTGSESLLLHCYSSSHKAGRYYPSVYGTAGVSCLASELFITKYFASSINLASHNIHDSLRAHN